MMNSTKSGQAGIRHNEKDHAIEELSSDDQIPAKSTRQLILKIELRMTYIVQKQFTVHAENNITPQFLKQKKIREAVSLEVFELTSLCT